MRVIFRRKARLELLETIDWYERQRTGLGERFNAEVKALMRRASETPGRFQHIRPGIGKVRLKRFPYFIYFTEMAGGIEVLAVVYARRNPEWIRKRIEE